MIRPVLDSEKELLPPKKTVPNFVPSLSWKPSQTVVEREGWELPVLARKFNTIAANRALS